MEKVMLVAGAKRGAIYDLRDGAVYSVDERSKALLLACKEKWSLSDIFSPITELSPTLCIAYLDKLCESGLGRYCAVGEISEEILPEKIPARLEFVWLEVVAGCNLNCIHCYQGGCPSLIGSEKMQLADWKRVIDEARDLGCEKLQFIGGEPLIMGDGLVTLIEYARTIGFTFIEVFTNATLLTEKFLSVFAANKVHVAISFYGERPETHELITLSPGSHRKTLAGIKKVLDAGVDLRVAVVGMRQNETECERTIAYLKEIGIKEVRFDVVRPSGRGTSVDIVSEKLLGSVMQKHPAFPPCTEDVFLRRISGHDCFSRKMCIGADGVAYPCIMERRVNYGSVLQDSLVNILNGSEAVDVRGLSKDRIAICKDCEYRYACSDCRPKAVVGEEASFASKLRECFYDPYSGKWKL
jgi:radical SAM protein with 4Fe4S-binding SPASM domain